jgi:hypothetical protein|tara:strand:+ start:11566 stop:11799 length:234 start_codon:yes stop_codon:yes gene_type:complete
MKSYQRVKGHSNLVRDTRTGVILNTNKTEIETSKKLKLVQQEKDQRITRLTDEVDTLRNDVQQIKELLFRLVEDKHE